MTKRTPPNILANLAGGNQPVALIDANFAAAVYGDTAVTQNNVPLWGDTVGEYITTGLPTNPAFGTITTIVGLDASNKLPAVDGSNLTNLPSTVAQGIPRQTVSAGPVDTNGLPSFLPASTIGLALTSQNITSSAPFVATSANNCSATTGLPVNFTGFATGNLTWSGLTNTTTNYLYVTISNVGVLTPGFTTTAPIYQWGGTPATTNGLITFNIGEMRCYLGNGTTAPQTYLVVVGEAVTSGGNVTSTVAYAYNGQYDSGFTATLPGNNVAVSKNHNIGVMPQIANFVIECTTNDQGFTAGQELINPAATYAGPNPIPSPPRYDAKTIAVTGGVGGAGWGCLNASAGTFNQLTNANWKYKFIARRGW